jgi:hypothetical protein
MKPNKISQILLFVFFSIPVFSQTGTAFDPFNSISNAATVTTSGTYFFNIGGQSFSTFVDNNGFTLVAIDFGGSSGNIPTTSILTTSSRGLLTPQILKNLDFFNVVKLTGPTINYLSTNQLSVNRVKNFKPLMRGMSDNSYATDWTNNGGSGTTQFSSSCVGQMPPGVTNTDSIKLSQLVFHGCGNVNGIHWMPWLSFTRERHNSGNISSSSSLRLWIKTTCTPPLDPGFGINKWNVNGYSYDEINTSSDFNSMTNLTSSAGYVNYGFYTDANLNIATTNKWAINSNPSTASNWTGCVLKNDNFVIQFRRKGFPSGFYKISLPYNDDGVKIFLNGSEIYSLNDCCADRGVIFQGALCSTSELEIRMIEIAGGSRLNLNIEAIPWPVDAGINADVIGGDTYSIGTIVNSPNAALISSNTWASDPVTSISSSVPVTVTPNETTTYTLTSVANGCSYSDEITLTVIGLLPVELISFEVNCIEENSKEITWSTASERNSAYFTIEKSNDGINWNEINKVQAAGNSTSILQYSTIDNVIDDKTVYYRLNQVDTDGENKLYDAKSIICSYNEMVRIYPNPTTDGKFSLSKNVEYTIFDSVGNKINSIEKSGVYILLIDGKLYKLVNL